MRLEVLLLIMAWLFSLQESDIILDVLGRAGHPIINSPDTVAALTVFSVNDQPHHHAERVDVAKGESSPAQYCLHRILSKSEGIKTC